MIVTVFSSGVCATVRACASIIGYSETFKAIGAPVGGFTGGMAGGGGGGTFVPGGGGGLLGGK